MYIYATTNTSGIITEFEIVVSKLPEDATHKNIVINSGIPNDFYEGCDGYRPKAVTVGGETSYTLELVSSSVVSNKRYVMESVSGIMSDQGITEKMATAIMALPWHIERTNIISSFDNL